MHTKSSIVIGLALATAAASSAQAPTLPPGYQATIFHQDVSDGPLTGLAVDAAGDVYTIAQSGVVLRLLDLDDDGVAEVAEPVWDGSQLDGVTGAAWANGHLIVSHLQTISRVSDTDGDGELDAVFDVVTDLPFGWHQNNAIFRGDDPTVVYFGIGSTKDKGVEPDPLSATLVSYDSKTGLLDIVAEGLRNTFDGAVHPVTGDILVGDNGPNTVTAIPDPDDEINLVRPGPRAHFGHPFNWGATTDPGYKNPLVLVPPHASPCGMTFNSNVGMSGYRNEGVMTTFSMGSSVVKVPLIYGQNEARAWITPFVTGLQGAVDVVFDDDGAMYVVEYGPARVLRVSQIGDARIVIEGQPSIGESCSISLLAPNAPYHFAFPAASSGLVHGSPINFGAPGLDVYLDAFSKIFALSTTTGGGSGQVFDFPQPTPLNAQGHASITIHIPSDPSLVGYTLHVQASIWDLGGSGLAVGVTPPQPLRILPQF